MVTKLMEEVYQKMEKDEDVEPNNKILIDWINDKVDTLYKMQRSIKESPATICMGELKDGEYSTVVDTCLWNVESFKLDECHIFRGLGVLADAVGAEITHRIHGGTPDKLRETIVFEFKYRGITFYQLERATLK